MIISQEKEKKEGDVPHLKKSGGGGRLTLRYFMSLTRGGFIPFFPLTKEEGTEGKMMTADTSLSSFAKGKKRRPITGIRGGRNAGNVRDGIAKEDENGFPGFGRKRKKIEARFHHQGARRGKRA